MNVGILFMALFRAINRKNLQIKIDRVNLSLINKRT